MTRSTLLVSGGAALLLLVGASSVPALPKDGDPLTPAEAMARARPLLDAAVKATPEKDDNSKAFKDNAEGLRSAWGLLKLQSREGLKQGDFKSLWNEAATLFHYHRVEPAPDYQMERGEVTGYPVRYGLPAGRGWAYSGRGSGESDQIGGNFRRTLANGRVTREIKIWIYSWNVVYSGVGGENAKGMAERDMAADRGGMTKVTFRSGHIVTARMGKGFPKTSYYEIVGEDDKLGPVRRRNYFVKGSSTTFNFEVIECRKTDPADDPWTAWQTAGPDAELEAILENFEEAPAKRK